MFRFLLFRCNVIRLGGPEPPSLLRQEHISITLPWWSFAQSVFFFIRAGSCLDSVCRQSGSRVKFPNSPRPFLSGKNAAATLPTLLVSCGALEATLPRGFPRSPDMRDSLPPRAFASQGTLEIAEVGSTSLCVPRVWRLFGALAIFRLGLIGRRRGRNFFVWRRLSATSFLDT